MAELLATLGSGALRDPDRLRALRRSQLLDTAPEPALDSWTSLAARTMPAPVALLTLLDEDREVVKSSVGLPPGVAAGGELPLSQSLCALIVESEHPLVIGDAERDPRVSSHGAVVELGVRAYLGMPVRDCDGHVLGAICAIDTSPRRWTDANFDVLEAIAISIELELRLAASRREGERLQQIVSSHHAVHDLIVAGAPLADTLEVLIRGVESQADGMRGSVLLHDRQRGILEHAASPRLPCEYTRAIDGLAIGPGCGSCGTAVHFKCEVIAADIATDPHWENHRDLADRHGLGACWSVPINDADGQVVGTFAFYDDKPRRPTPGELTLIRHASRLAGIAIERHRDRESLVALADRDSLTGLANREMLLREMRRLLSPSPCGRRSLAVLFCDLNRFKLINDSLGHGAGDRVLSVIARRLASCAGPDDTVARLGGDEFVIVATDLDAGQARELAGRAARVLARPILDAATGTEHRITASIGVALNDGEGDADDLIRHADTAMFDAKRSGTGISFYQSDSRAGAIKELQLHSALRAALETDQLHVVYQPVVALATGRMAGAEALLRWIHPTSGPVSPADFIPVAERHGLISDLGDWVLRRAATEALAWNELTDRPVPVAVNVSARQLIDPGFSERVRAILVSTRMAPSLLTLEITETALVGDDSATLANLRELGELGVAIALDDFGTGYSSLSHLRRLPIDTVKVDRSFIAGLGTDHDDTAIVTGVIAMARGLNLLTVAEGVETEAQAEALRRLGCQYGQGFLYARPMSAADMVGAVTGPRR